MGTNVKAKLKIEFNSLNNKREYLCTLDLIDNEITIGREAWQPSQHADGSMNIFSIVHNYGSKIGIAHWKDVTEKISSRHLILTWDESSKRYGARVPGKNKARFEGVKANTCIPLTPGLEFVIPANNPRIIFTISY